MSEDQFVGTKIILCERINGARDDVCGVRGVYGDCDGHGDLCDVHSGL